MLNIKELEIEGYEKVVEATESVSGLHSIIAIHDTTLGPSLGGIRCYPYASKEDALEDALRLSRGMTYKSAMAEIGLGGGKSVIIADPIAQKNNELLLAFAEVVDRLQGQYICAEDVGTSPEDLLVVGQRTPYVAGLPTPLSSGDPSPFTAWGVYRSMEAVAEVLWGGTSLCGKTVAIQGLGHVGAKLADFLFWRGVKLIVADIDPTRCAEAKRLYGAEVIDTKDFCSTECDILAPCALGAVINDQTINTLRCWAIAGSANNQLLRSEHGEMLAAKGILYAPDFVCNSGGIINASIELDTEGYNPARSREKVDQIFDTILAVFDIAQERGLSPRLAAYELAESKLKCGVGKRTTKPRLTRCSSEEPAA